MISITCTNCRANLTIDDAFAGGVCRCQFCGTIQTVPAKGKPVTATSTTSRQQPAATSKTLYQNKARSRQAGANGTGLDDLANAVVSSGLTGSGLSSQRHVAKVGDEPQRRNLVPILLVACAVLVVLLGIVLTVVLLHGRGTSGTGTLTTDSGQSQTALSATFCGIPLHSTSTIFLLDRGNSITEQFDTVKAVSFKAIDQFGPSRKFQVILWDNDTSGEAEFPVGQMLDATAGNTTELRRYFQDAIATGRSHLSGVLKEAASRNPQEIIIATGKGADDLDEDDAAVLQSMVGRNIRIDAVQVYPVSPSPNKVLQEVSRATGGQFRNVSAAELREFAH